MADQNITVKLGLDTSQFSNSIKGMTNELRALSKIDLSILSEEDKKAAISRMGDLKDSIKELKTAVDQADPGQFFQSFSTLAGPAIAGISGLAVGMEMFGAKTEEVDAIQRKLMGVISLISTLQTISDANKLKGILKQIPLQYVELKNRITNTLLIKAETAAQIGNTAAQEASANTIKKLTTLQKLWNLAVAANPIMLIITGLILLTTTVWGLSKAFKSNNEEQEKTIELSNEMKVIFDELYYSNLKFKVELGSLLGVYSDYDKALKLNEIQLEENTKKIKAKEEADIKALKATEEQINLAKNVWKNFLITMESKDQKEVELAQKRYDTRIKFLEDESLQAFKIYRDSYAEQLKLRQEHDEIIVKSSLENSNSLWDEIKNLETENVKDEKEKLDISYYNQQESFKKKYKLEEEEILKTRKLTQDELDYISDYNHLMELLEQNHINKINELNKKKYDELHKLNKDYYDKLVSETQSSQDKLNDLSNPQSEQSKLQQKYYNDLLALEEFYKKNKGLEEERLKSIEQLERKYQIESEILTLKSDEEKYKKRTELHRQYVKQTIEQQRQAELKQMLDTATANGSSPKQIAEYRAAINKKYDDQIYEYRKGLGVISTEEEMQREIDLIDRKLLTEEQYQKAKAGIIEKYTRTNADIRMIQEQMVNSFISNSFNLMMENQQVRHQNELNELSKSYDEKYKMLDDELKYRQITQEEYDARKAELDKKKETREKQLKIKQAKEEKNLALFQVAIQTGVAVMKLFATMPYPAAMALMPWVVGQGLIESAFIAARPLPQYKEGSKTPFDPNGNDSGLAVLHQGEFVMNKNATDNNLDLLRQLNSGQNVGTMNYQQMVEYVNLSFAKYNSIPVIVKETEMTEAQNKVKNIQVNAEI